jgi:hypothetical protein
MNSKTKERKVSGSYAPPVCEEVPMRAEGPLCESNETVGETNGIW